jgi:drug/metabolite transporter (DMT)-like permease
MSVTTNLTIYDMVAARFFLAGLICAPVLMRLGIPFDRPRRVPLLLMLIGAGLPMVFCAVIGLSLAPARHGGVMFSAMSAVFGAITAAIFLRERMSGLRSAGLLVTMVGMALIAGMSLFEGSLRTSAGHALFLAGALAWAFYTVGVRKSGISSMHGTAIVIVLSWLLYIPIYALFLPKMILTAPVGEIAFQILYQGVASLFALYAFARSVAILGAGRASAFAALVPVLAALASVPILGERLDPVDALGILLAASGVYLASGGRLPRRRPAPSV